MSDAAHEVRLTAGPEDRLPAGKAAILGIQHVLAMDVYVVPFIIASALGLAAGDSALVIQSAFVAAGLATLIQSQWCMKLPVVQGPSYIPIGAVLAIAFGAGGGLEGLSTVFGALIPGAILVALLGYTGLFHRFINRVVPPLVGGAIILVVGIALMPVALSANVFAVYGPPATIGGNIVMALSSAVLLVASMMIGIRLGGGGTWLRICSVLIALAGGSLAAASMGQLNLSAVGAADWFTLPHMAFISFKLSFSGTAILTMLLVYVVLMAETTGTWFAVGAVIDHKLPDRQLDRGAVGEGLGCLVSAVLGSTPVTGYSSNAGIIAITGIASRTAFCAAGVVLVALGLCGKLSAAIASIPAPVIGGVFAVLCTVIAMNGIRVVRRVPLTERNMLVIGLPVLAALFATLAPQDYIKTLPQLAQYFLGSSVAVGAILAIILHQVLPSSAEDK